VISNHIQAEYVLGNSYKISPTKSAVSYFYSNETFNNKTSG